MFFLAFEKKGDKNINSAAGEARGRAESGRARTDCESCALASWLIFSRSSLFLLGLMALASSSSNTSSPFFSSTFGASRGTIMVPLLFLVPILGLVAVDAEDAASLSVTGGAPWERRRGEVGEEEAEEVTAVSGGSRAVVLLVLCCVVVVMLVR